MEKFHYNPIGITKQTLHFFPNLETLHLYDFTDEYLISWKIQRYVDWNERECYETNDIQENNNKPIDFKRIVYSSVDYQLEEDNIILIPKGVQWITDKCFFEVDDIYSILIPSTITAIGSQAFDCCCLKEITLSSTDIEMAKKIVSLIVNI